MNWIGFEGSGSGLFSDTISTFALTDWSKPRRSFRCQIWYSNRVPPQLKSQYYRLSYLGRSILLTVLYGCETEIFTSRAGWKCLESGEKYVIRSPILHIPRQILLGWSREVLTSIFSREACRVDRPRATDMDGKRNLQGCDIMKTDRNFMICRRNILPQSSV
jgi:hypothetical protein